MKKWRKRGLAVLLAAATALNTGAFSSALAADTEAQAASIEAEEAARAESERAAAEEAARAESERLAQEEAARAESERAAAEEAARAESERAAAEEAARAESERLAQEEAARAESERAAAEEAARAESEQLAQQTESETEAEADGVYTWQEGALAAQVTLPETVTLPENAELKIKAEAADGDAYKDSVALVEKTAAGLYFGEYLVYDIHFEADGEELALKDYAADGKLAEDAVKVEVTFAQPVFAERDVKNRQVKVYHIKDLTPEELAAAEAETARQQAESAAADGEASEGATDGTEDSAAVDKQKAVDVKTDATLTQAKDAVEKITFYTDGFSRYVFAVTAEAPQTETPDTQPETESEASTESESTTESESVSESESTSESESQSDGGQQTETEIVPVLDLDGDMDEQRQKLEITVSHLGKTDSTVYQITVKADTAAYDFKDVKLQIGDGAEQAVDAGTIKDGTLTIPVTVQGAGKTKVQLSGLADGNYTVDAGGSWFDAAGALKQTAGVEYTSLYWKNGGVTNSQPGDAASANYENQPASVTILAAAGTRQGIGNQTLDIVNLYTTLELKLESGKKPVTAAGAVYTLAAALPTAQKKILNDKITLANGVYTVKGLPTGDINGQITAESAGSIVYTWQMNAGTYPQGYINPSATGTQAGTLKAGTVSSAMETQPTMVRLNARYADGKEATGLTMTVKDETTNSVWKESYQSGQVVSGKFEVGHKYTITQTARPAGYIISTVSYEISKIENSGKEQGTGDKQHTVNKPIVVKVGDVLKSDNTYLAGGSLEILAADKTTRVVTGITSQNGLYELSAEQRKKIEPGKKYYLHETGAPQGHYAAEADRYAEFSLNAGGEATATLKYVATRICVRRYYYDKNPFDKDGKGTPNDTSDDLKPLKGVTIEIVNNATGAVVYTGTSGEDGRFPDVVGALNMGGEYTIRETSVPAGYAKANNYTFSTQIGATAQGETVGIDGTTGNISPYSKTVAMLAARYGSVEVAKRVSVNGKGQAVDRTFYFGLFTDKELTKLYYQGSIEMTTAEAFGTATVTNVPARPYYLAETDGRGNPITGGTGEEEFTATVGAGTLTVVGGGTARGNILNNFTKISSSTGRRDLTDDEQTAWNSVGSEYSGTTDGDGNDVSTTSGGVSTNDPTKFLPYILLIAAALAVIGGAIAYKRKKR